MPRTIPWLLLLLGACAPQAGASPVTAPHPPASAPPPAPASLSSLGEGDHVQGFVARALYVDDDGTPRGARFVHERTRLVFDYLVIESAPQAYLYATTYPTSDGGAPHTQEHLLLGKGNKGRWLGNYDHVMLATWSAATWQYRTGYHFKTAAGTSAFWGILRTQLDALLHPDYSDEEIRREVRNFGVGKRPDGTLGLDEKGTVYNEMVRTYEAPATLGWDALGRLVYGADHPLALSSGGTPEGIRALTPADIRAFHDAHYQLANMGMIGAFPSSVALPEVLARVGATLDALAPGKDERRYLTESDLPPPHGAPEGTVRVVEYPYATPDQPSPAILAWPATRHLDAGERTAMEAFLAAFAGGESSTMYDALVDRKTRVLDVGATSVWAYSNDDPGQAVFLGVESVSATHTDEATLRAIRDLTLAKLRAVAALPDGSPELAAFDERMKARLLDGERRLDKALDTPPGFGDRGASDFWIRHLTEVGHDTGFRKSLDQKAAYDHAMALATSRSNPWRERIAAWGLLETPYGVMTRASPELRRHLDAARDARVAAETARLEATYGTTDAQEALRRREAEIARATAEIARAESTVPMPPFVSDPPMTLDDSLAYRTTSVAGVPVVASTFESMKSSSVGLVLRVEGVAPADLPYLALLPSLLRDVGLVRDGVPIPYDAMDDRLRREVLALDVGYDTSFATGRVELAVTGSGADVDETRRALGWMRDVLASPDWRPENLPRLRDVVGRAAASLRDVMSGPEEGWAFSSAEAYRRQDSPLLAHTASFLTRAHDAFRLSWMLEGADAPLSRYLASLGSAGKKLDRAGLRELAQALARIDGKGAHDHETPARVEPWLAAGRVLGATSRARAARAGRELAQLLGELPDASLASDWADLCATMAHGAARDPREAVDGLRRALAAIVHAGGARVWMVGSSRSQEALASDLQRLLGGLPAGSPVAVTYPEGSPVTDRARARGATVFDARVASLVDPSTANGALVDSAPTAGFDETSRSGLVDFLAANVFSGSGAHSFYKRIWGAALAYSGYIAVSPRTGRMHVYSDRCADLPALMSFIDGEVRAAPADARFVDYAVANTFGARTGAAFEDRAASMARDLAEGVTPERVRGFRERLLAMRSTPGLAEAIHARLVPVYAAVAPSLAPPGAPVPPGALWFAIGPEAQLARYNQALRAARGQPLSVLRLYPRDFWL